MNPMITLPQVAQGSEGSAIFVLAGLGAIVSAVFWMVVGWRAMRAHEKMADAAVEIARRGVVDGWK